LIHRIVKEDNRTDISGKFVLSNVTGFDKQMTMDFVNHLCAHGLVVRTIVQTKSARMAANASDSD
jgi:hypothetical protein